MPMKFLRKSSEHLGARRRVATRLAVVTRIALAVACLCLALPAGSLHAQSGRGKQPPADAVQSPKAAPPADSSNSKPATPQSSPQPNAPGKPGTAEEAAGEDEVVRISSNLVAVTASVRDERGLPASNLKLEDFELLVDGRAVTVGDLSRSETPVRLALLFDNSGSVSPSRELQLRAAVQFFRTVMRPVDQAAVYSVSTEPALVRPLTSDVKALVHTIENFSKPEGATALFDAIARAADYLRPQQYRKVIVIVSDGVDTISDLDFDGTLRHIQEADCQIFVVQTGYVDNANLRDLVAESRMDEFAAQTGGAVFRPQVADDLYAAFSQIAADLSQQYVLGYYPSGERRDGQFHAITLRVKTRPNMKVRARKGYYSPKG
jgi:Ca-activated chloride channel family protein